MFDLVLSSSRKCINCDLIVNTEEAIRFIMDYVDKNKHIFNCAYDSMGHEEIKRFFYADLINVMSGAINSGERTLNLTVSEDFKSFLAAFYTEASAGILIDWIKNKFKQDRETILQNILLIYKVSIPQILEKKALPRKEPVSVDHPSPNI